MQSGLVVYPVLFIFQALTSEGTVYIGNVDGTLEYYPPTMKDIRRVEQTIKEGKKLANVVVVNIILLSADEDD